MIRTVTLFRARMKSLNHVTIVLFVLILLADSISGATSSTASIQPSATTSDSVAATQSSAATSNSIAATQSPAATATAGMSSIQPSATQTATASTTSSSTTTTTTTTPSPDVKYPITKPKLDKLSYKFGFTLLIDASDEGKAIEKATDIAGKLKKRFEDDKIKGFKDVVFKGIKSPATRRKRAAANTQTAEFDIVFNSVEANKNQQAVTDSIEKNVKEEAENAGAEVGPTFNQRLAKFVTGLNNICGSGGGNPCPDPLQVFICNSTYQACVNPCSYKTCGDNGECRVVYDEAGTASAQCQCSSDGLYDFSGEHCENSNMKWLYVLAITFTILAAVIIFLMIATIVICHKMEQDKNLRKISVQDDQAMRDEPMMLEPRMLEPRMANPRIVEPMYRNNTGMGAYGRIDATPTPDYYTPYKSAPERRHWADIPFKTDSGRMEQKRSSFRAYLQDIDDDYRHAIKRPQYQ